MPHANPFYTDDFVISRKIVLDALRQLASTSQLREIEDARNGSASKETSESEVETDEKTCNSGSTSNSTLADGTSQKDVEPDFSGGQCQPSGADLANSTYVKDFSRLVVDKINNQSESDPCTSKFSVCPSIPRR